MSSSARDLKTNSKPRKRSNGLGYNMPGHPAPVSTSTPNPAQAPEFIICDHYGDERLQSALVPLAWRLFSLDDQLLRRVQRFHKKHSQSLDEARKAKIVPLLKACNDVEQQWKAIKSGKSQFNVLYMKSHHFIPIWREGLKIIKEAIGGNQISKEKSKMRKDYEDIIEDCDAFASQLMREMVAIANRGLLDPGVVDAIQERWIRLDEVLNWYYNLCNKYADTPEHKVYRESPSWTKVRDLIQPKDAKTKGDEDPIHTQPVSDAEIEAEPNTVTGLSEGEHFKVFLFWSAFFGCAVISTALFALGYGRSLHVRGSADDPDFWFLIQGTYVQILGLIVSALVEKNRGGRSKWRWCLPTAVAGACATASIPLYLFVPKEWSSFLSAIAGATQTFMTLQYFLL